MAGFLRSGGEFRGQIPGRPGQLGLLILDATYREACRAVIIGGVGKT